MYYDKKYCHHEVNSSHEIYKQLIKRMESIRGDSLIQRLCRPIPAALAPVIFSG